MPVPAGVIGDDQMTAVVALIDMASQQSGSAPLNGLHGPELIVGEAVGFSVVVSVLTKEVGYL
jgi:hypothetical protein